MKKIVITVIATVFAMLLFLNLGSGEKKVVEPLAHLYGIRDPNFLRSMSGLLGPSFIQGNSVVSLTNGDQIFPAMLKAIESAEKTICFETYIYWSGEIGEKFSKVLSEKAQSGVKVHVLLDWVGAGKMDEAIMEKMRSAGVQINKYHAPRWNTISRLNNRTHRKLLIIDGKMGFTGGVGIADQWLGNAEDPDHWRDSHFQLEGPAVAQMQGVFMDNWIKATAAVFHGPDYFPPLEPTGGTVAQVFKSSAQEGSESIRLMYLLSLASAEKTILIANSYFVPDDLTIQTLVDARKRGVRIEILVPGREIDAPLVRRASRARWGPLLEAGVHIFEYQPTMYHCKVMVVDSVWVSVGSTNFDNRSFRLNDEANLNIFDETIASEQTELFEADKRSAQEITFSRWKDRPILEKVIEHTSALLRTQL